MATEIIPTTQELILDGGFKLVSTLTNGALTMILTNIEVDQSITMVLTQDQTESHVNFLHKAESAFQLTKLATLQGKFETEMGAELTAFNSQALTKDLNTREYLQAVTRIAFVSYQKGLDGPPA